MTIFERVSIGLIPQDHSKPYITKAWAFPFFVGYFGGYPKIAPETSWNPSSVERFHALPETNMAPENDPLEQEISIGTITSMAYVSFLGSVVQRSKNFDSNFLSATQVAKKYYSWKCLRIGIQ